MFIHSFLPPNCLKLSAGIAASVLLAVVPVASAAMLGSDSAGNYSTATWVSGSNLGTGFGAWTFTNSATTGTSFSGEFIGDSTAGTGNINTGGNSFAMYANPNGAFSNAARAFGGGALTLGQKFSIQLAVNFRNGAKGINLSAGGTQVFNFNVGGDDYNYQIGSGASVSTGFAYYSDSVFTLAYTQQSATAGLFTISRTSATGGAAASSSTSVALPATSGVTSFTLYNSNTTDGSSQNNLYFNNLAVVPEPSSIALIALGLTGAVVARRRRR